MKRYGLFAKGMSILLSTMMVASFMPVAAHANEPDNNYFDEGLDNKYGDPETGKTDKLVNVEAWKEDVGVAGGDIKCNTEEDKDLWGGLNVYADAEYDYEAKKYVEGGEKYTATVTTGSINNEDQINGIGADIETYAGGTADVTVNGDVSGGFHGVYNEADKDGKINVFVSGDASGGCSGVYARADRDGKINVFISGDANGGIDGVEALADRGGKIDVFISGDVVGKESSGFYADANRYEKDEYGTVNAYVEGTITGKEIGVGFYETGKENITITTWAITPNEDGAVAGYWQEGDSFVKDEQFEKENINYIIKVEQPRAGAALAASKDTAKEGEKVLLRVDLQEGYEITGAYDDNGILQKYALSKDEDGNYYVIVPKGGGVYLTVTAQKIPDPVIPTVVPVALSGDDTSGNTDNNTKVNTPAVSAEVQAAVSSISETPAGGTANITITDNKLDASVVSTLLARRDINVSITCFINGKLCTIMIPAGADLSDLIRPDGTIDLEKLAERFGKIEV